jgi:glycosyltransferase involved in cell wall biosynthesis
MGHELRTSLIITTYNWPEALRATLGSVLRQSIIPAEVIVADDGSGPETEKTVRQSLDKSTIKWRHVWHEDKGIRQARIKNLGVRYSKGEYLIFIDHDVVLHPEFVKDHLSCAGKGVFLQGKRTFLSEHDTREALSRGESFPLPSFFAGKVGNRKNALRAPAIGRFLSRKGGFQKSLRGCNLSLYREDFLLADGFDETFDGLWGREDSDLCYRLFNGGVKVMNLWFCAIQYHLHHPVRKNCKRDRLDEELERILKERRRKALRGFSQLSDEGGILASFLEENPDRKEAM